MVETTGVEFDEEALRQKLAEQRDARTKTQVRLEEPADFGYNLDFANNKTGEKYHIRFTRWTQADVNRFNKLAYIKKKELTPEDEADYLRFKISMVDGCLDPKSKKAWMKMQQASLSYVNVVFNAIAIISGVDRTSKDEIDEFIDSEQGQGYGQLWFMFLGKTPSEVGRLPATDVYAVSRWWTTFAPKVGKQDG